VTPAVLKKHRVAGPRVLIAIGGDDTLSYASELDRKGMKVIAVPKTMDNDVRNTEYCIGFSTAITRAMEPLNASAPPWVRMSALASFACLAAMLVTRCSMRHA
jgi:6-phosphofructokinase